MEWYDWLLAIILICSINGKSKGADFNFVLAIAIGIILWKT